MPILRVLSVLLVLASLASGQAELDIPEALQPFWSQYHPARMADDEAEMDRLVRIRKNDAIDVLDLLLDDLSRVDDPDLRGEVRALAWSLDRIDRQERFIERVRLVLDMTMLQRRQRAKILDNFFLAKDLGEEALSVRSEEAWDAANSQYLETFNTFYDLGDIEFALFCLVDASELERRRGRPWEQSRLLKRIVSLGTELSYTLLQATEAETMLANLKAKGIDPDGPKPEEIPEDLREVESDSAGGRGLTSWAPASSALTVKLRYKVPKKGLAGVSLPSFHPLDNYLLWPSTWIEGDGPEDMDSTRQVLRPREATWKLWRDGAVYFIDVDDDGEEEVEFTPNTSPKLIEVPLSKNSDDSIALMVAIPGDREDMFGLEVNYAPTPGWARLRFHIAGQLEAKVLGKPWKIFDSNVTGTYGDEKEYWDDLITESPGDEHISFFAIDSVLIAKAKKAIPWSAVLPVGDAFYRAQIDPAGTSLELRELHLATGQVKLELDTKVSATHVVIKELNKLEGAYFDVLPVKRGKLVTVPVGTYKLAFGRLETGKKTSMKQVRIYPGKSKSFTVEADKTHVLRLGGPYRLTVDSQAEGKETVVDTRTLRIFGQAGEEYACLFDDPLQPELSVIGANGKAVIKPKKLLTVGISAFSENKGKDNILWFPAEARYETPREAGSRVRLFQKTHRLLGGPLDTEETP